MCVRACVFFSVCVNANMCVCVCVCVCRGVVLLSFHFFFFFFFFNGHHSNGKLMFMMLYAEQCVSFPQTSVEARSSVYMCIWQQVDVDSSSVLDYMCIAVRH